MKLILIAILAVIVEKYVINQLPVTRKHDRHFSPANGIILSNRYFCYGLKQS